MKNMREKIKEWSWKLQLLKTNDRAAISLLLLMTASFVGLYVNFGPIKLLAACILGIMIGGFALLLPLVPLWKIAALIAEAFRIDFCTERVIATVEGYETEEARGIWQGKEFTAKIYKARFSYKYKGKAYSGVLNKDQAGERDEVRKEFPIGSKREIYISTGRPERISKKQRYGVLSLMGRLPALLFWLVTLALLLLVVVICFLNGYEMITSLM